MKTLTAFINASFILTIETKVLGVAQEVVLLAIVIFTLRLQRVKLRSKENLCCDITPIMAIK